MDNLGLDILTINAELEFDNRTMMRVIKSLFYFYPVYWFTNRKSHETNDSSQLMYVHTLDKSIATCRKIQKSAMRRFSVN